MAAMSDDARQAAVDVESLPDEEKKQVVEQVRHANPDLFPGGDRERTQIWLTLLIGLFVIAVAGLIGFVWLAAKDHEGASAVIAVTSAVVAGVIGLFAKPPTGT